MLGFFEEDEDDKKLLGDVVKHYQPSMRLTENGCGGWCLSMSTKEGRRTAKNKSGKED